MSPTLGDLLPLEIQRCRQLLADYESLGAPGVFGAAALQAELEAAEKALIEQDAVAMLSVYNRLRELS